MKWMHAAFIGALGLLTASQAIAECLPRLVAPGKFLNVPRSWGKDSGPIINGFLSLSGPRGDIAIKHGVDLSKYNENVPYDIIKRCGADFAIVKVDQSFPVHLAGLTRVGISILPYFYLSVATDATGDFKLKSGLFEQADGGPDGDNGSMTAVLSTAEVLGASKARAFLTNYSSRVPERHRQFNLAGLSGQLIVVDVEETLATPRSTLKARKNFGRFYARMLATWIADVRQQLPQAIFVFYTFPAVYQDYLQYALPADHAVIHGMPVWLARTRGDGSDFDLKSDKGLQRLCLSASGGNRCIIHQYSHRVLFASTPWPKTGFPRHVDADRLFNVAPTTDSKGIQYVRQD